MRNAASLVVAAFLTACGGSETNSASQDVPFSTVVQSGNSGVAVPQGVVARNQGEFDAVWAMYSANAQPPPQPPAIDFNTYEVVGYFLGSRPNGCYAVSITRVTQTSDRLVVTYTEQTPGRGAICTPQIVNPAHFVQVPQSQLQVEFTAQ